MCCLVELQASHPMEQTTYGSVYLPTNAVPDSALANSYAVSRCAKSDATAVRERPRWRSEKLQRGAGKKTMQDAEVEKKWASAG